MAKLVQQLVKVKVLINLQLSLALTSLELIG